MTGHVGILKTLNIDRKCRQEYLLFIQVFDSFRQRNYDEKQIRSDNCPFLVQDVLFNTLLSKSNKDLAKIAELLGKNPAPYNDRAKQTAEGINTKLWCPEEQMYTDFNLISSRRIKARVVAGFLPLFAEIPDQKKKQKIFEYLNTHCFCQLTDTCFPAPSYDRSGKGYSKKMYWRGPVWINMNWLLAEGLKQYGYEDYVQQLINSMIQLPFISGFREYYDTEDGKGYGTDGFSWTASLLLDVLYREKPSAFL